MNLVDTPYSTLHAASKIKAAGYTGVIRYISPSTSTFPTKRISPAEAHQLHALGMAIGLVWEKTDKPGEMTSANGALHAKSSVAVAKGLGAPPSIGIFLAVDFDADVAHEMDEVRAYFAAAQPIIKAGGYLVGVYGSGIVCKTLHDAGIAHYTWLAQSSGWGGYSAFKAHAHIVQGKTTKVAGLDVDLNVAQVAPVDAGLWF